MESSPIIEVLKHPNENGIVVFVLGVLFVLSIYHFLLYFQNKDKTYLFYSIYTTLIFIAHLHDPKSGFISTLLEPINYLLTEIDLDFTWAYNMLYFIFAFTFIDLKSFSIKWHNFIFRAIYLLCFFSILFEVLYRVSGDYRIISNGHMFFVSYLFVLGTISYIPLFRINSPLKYYIIIGSTFLFGTSLLATFLHKLNMLSDGNEINYSIFYIGVIIENILFSLGLGHKQKLILKEKKESQEKLIIQLKKNEELQLAIQKKFEQDVVSLNEKAEVDKLEALKVKYDKELTDLKMASLRNQMNPHFIFNSLNSIKSYIIDNEKENAIYYLNKFSKLIRKILATTREKEITLANEIETLELYINIENIRFNNEIEYSMNIDKNINIETIKVPSLILQPFIENAIWHGLSLKKDSKKLIITIETNNDSHVEIIIEDNGIGREKSTAIKQKKIHKKDSIGIKLTEERLNKFSEAFKHDYSLSFKDLYDNDTPIGTRVTLKLPIV